MNRPKKQAPRAPAAKRRSQAPMVGDSLFQAAFHNSPAMQSVVRASDSVLIEVNDTFLKKLGFRRDEVIGKTAFQLNFWVEPEKLGGVIQHLQAKGFLQGDEVRLRARNGEILTVLLSTHPVEIGGVQYFLSAGVDITARKQAEAELRISNERLRQSEERFTKVFRTSPALVIINRLSDSTFVAANETFLRTSGYSEAEIVGKKALELDLHAIPGQREAFLQHLREHGYVRDREMHVRAKDGQIRTLLVSAEIIEMDGEPHVQIVGLDISERKRTESQLQKSEQKFRALFEGSSQGVMIHDEEKFLAVNSATLRILGFDSAEPVLGKHPKDTSPPFQPNGESSDVAARRHIATCLETGSDRFEWVGLNSRGEEMDFEVILTRVEWDGRTAIQAVINDISERKKAEAKLRESEARLRESEARFSTAFNACPVLMTIATLNDGRFVEVNDAFIRALALEREEVLGRNSEELSLWVSGEDRAKFFERLRRERSLRDIEGQARGRDGTVHTMQISADIIEINRRPHLLTFALDVTERKRAEAELQNALAKERELSQLKSDFVSLVSHEFRTPLEIIMSSADNLDRYYERLPAEKREQLLRTINKSVRRMSMMMEEVLVLGRLETDRMTFNPAAFDLKAFCRRVCDEIESATAKRCPIDLRLHDAEEAIGDESILRHIFTNLLTNAVKYSQPDQHVELIVEREVDKAVCRIVDHGCGIPEADQKGLFQAFHRGSNVRQIPGTGLGLLIVQRCVELHGGEIQFESTEGKGTTFTVRLPLFSPSHTRTHTLTPTPPDQLAEDSADESMSASKSKRIE